MAPQKNFFFFTLIIISLLLSMGVVPVNASIIPLTGTSTNSNAGSSVPQSTVNQFAAQIEDGSTNLRGVYNESLFAYRVVQQPLGRADYVSAVAGVVTQFSMANQAGSTGLLAHNYAAGAQFSELEMGDSISLVLGDGTIANYTVTNILEFQALQPNNPLSQFVNLETQLSFSATQLFNQVYSVSGRLVLQTCIQNGTVDSWGRLFIIAEPEA